jgi:hypothetical protein
MAQAGPMKTAAEISEDMDQMIRSHVPGWKVIAKTDSVLHRLIGATLGRFMDYMGSFWTTIGYTAAYPAQGQDDWDVKAHEGLHAFQAQKITRILFGLLYLFPQCLVPFFIPLAVFHTPWWLLASVLCVLPWPAPFRGMWELEAYRISILILSLQRSSQVDRFIEEIVSQHFAGPTYYYMFPFKNYVREKLYQAKMAGLHWNDAAHPEYSAEFKKNSYIVDIYNVMLAAGKIGV